MENEKPSVGSAGPEYLFESSVSEARWLFGFVLFSGVAVFAAGLVASIIAG